MPKITELTLSNTVSNTDYLAIVVNPDTLASTRKVRVEKLFNNVHQIQVNNMIITNNTTPANSTITVTRGKLFYDSNYLYISISDNILRRIPLEVF